MYENEEVALSWYQDPQLCKQVDNIDFVYDSERLGNMYRYLNANGYCYYIEYKGKLVGDIALLKQGEICLVICREYQNRHIGRKCTLNLLQMAREMGYEKVKANIYSFNTQSRKMFEAVGFRQIADEWYECSTSEAGKDEN